MINLKKPLNTSILLSTLVLSACGGSDSTSASNMKTYKVTISNVTANQPLSPATLVIHKSGYQLFQAGHKASVALEKLAEGGSNTELLEQANKNNAVLAKASGTGIIPPGSSESIELSVNNSADFMLSVATMLVNTNDAFAGKTTTKIANLSKGASLNMHIPIWDSGTEANSEAANTIPGPAGGGEGFNKNREDDVNFIAIHQGVVTHADGFMTSALDESHRFTNPGAMLRIERVK